MDQDIRGISGGKVTDLQPEIEKLRRQLEEKARHLAQAEARVARIQRELEATKSFGPDMDNDTRIRIKNLQNQQDQEKIGLTKSKNKCDSKKFEILKVKLSWLKVITKSLNVNLQCK